MFSEAIGAEQLETEYIQLYLGIFCKGSKQNSRWEGVA